MEAPSSWHPISMICRIEKWEHLPLASRASDSDLSIALVACPFISCSCDRGSLGSMPFSKTEAQMGRRTTCECSQHEVDAP